MMKHLLSGPLALSAAALMMTTACGDAEGSPGDTTADTTADTAPDTPEIVDDRPLGNVYRIDPLSTPNTEVVALEHLSDPDGALVGSYARVRSCTPDQSRGSSFPLSFGPLNLNLTTCVPESLARPGEDGTYLAFDAPETPWVGDAEFSEVMMYHHMQVIHDFFKDVHGLTDRDHPLEAITNIQAHVDLCDEWAKIANAAFIPEEGLDQLPFGIDLDIQGDAIIFSGTDARNFAFDATVIYHEYTHAMLGATRLNAVFSDSEGLNNLPGALNESYADYFAVAITDASNVGNYALNDLGSFAVCGFPLGGGDENMARDMMNERTCPDDLTAQVHADSEIFSSALWLIREALGPIDADRVILTGVLTLTNASDFQVAADATIDAARDLLGAEAEATVREAFEARSILGCRRIVPAARVGVRGRPMSIEPNNAFNPNPFPGYTPGYLQVSFEVPEGATRVELTLQLSASEGNAAPALDLALKPGGEPIAYTYGFGAGSVTHDGTVTLTVSGGKATLEAGAGQTLTPGTWVFATHNRGPGLNLGGVTVTDLSDS